MIEPSRGYRQRWVAGGIALPLAIVLAACGGSGGGSSSPTDPGGTGLSANGQSAVGKITNNTWELIHEIYNTAQSSAAGSNAEFTLFATSDTIQLNYNLTVSVSLRYYDSAGSEQQFYNPTTTTRIEATGSGSGSGASLNFNFTLTGSQTASNNLTVNGSASGTYDGVTVNTTVSNLVVPKEVCAIPTSGSISVNVEGITVTIRFNGTTSPSCSYNFGGRSFSCTATLTGCTVS